MTLKKRIRKLQENTSSLEAKEICKEILENFIDITDEQMTSAIVEKLKTINDADKHVSNFLRIMEKLDDVNNLGVANGIATIKTLNIYTYPGLRYVLEGIENQLIVKKAKVIKNSSDSKEISENVWNGLKLNDSSFRIVSNNVSGKPEFMVVDKLLEGIKNFTWDNDIKKIYDDIKEKRESKREEIDLSIGMYEMENNKGSFFFESLYPKMEDHFLNPTVSSRSSLIEEMKKFNYYPIVKNLSESLMKIQKKEHGNVEIFSDNSKCTVYPIYSPILLENAGEYFFIKGNYFCKKDKKITKITESENNLPENFKDLCRIISSPYVFVKEGKISFYLKRNKIDIFENENKKTEIKFNDNIITGNDLAKHMVSAGMFRLEESKIAYDVQKLAESYDSIYDIDFGKVIKSNIYEGCYAILMKEGNDVYLDLVNESNKSNEFYSSLTVLQARNKILEFLGFDIKESMDEYMLKEEKELRDLKEKQISINNSLSIIESNLEKIENSMGNEFVSNSPEVIELKKTLEQEKADLQETHRNIAQRIKMCEGMMVTSDSGLDVGDNVKLKENGELGVIFSINSNTNTVNIILSSGTVSDVPIEKVISLKNQIEIAGEKNAEPNDDEINAFPMTDLEKGDDKGSEGGNDDKGGEGDEKKKVSLKENDNESNSSDEESKIYIKGSISDDASSDYVGKNVEFLARDYTSKGDDDEIEVKIGDDIIFIEKKFIIPAKSTIKQSVIKPVPEENKNVQENEEEVIVDDDFFDDDPDDDPNDDPDDDFDDELDGDMKIIKNDEFDSNDKKDKESIFKSEEDPSENNVMISKLKKTLSELEDLRNDVKKTFTSSDTLDSIINSTRGMLDAILKDDKKM